MKKAQNIVSNKSLTVLLTFLGVFLLASALSWGLFSLLKSQGEGPSKVATNESKPKIDPNLPKTESCPINGRMFSKPEREIWEKRRPITAMIENHADARPQSGLSFADVVYETVAEGGITRFLTVFYCGASASDIRIAPIRSVRVYFVNWAAEYGGQPIFLHSGGANNICKQCPGGVKPYGQVGKEVDAFGFLEKLGWRAAGSNALDAGTNIGAPIVVRNQYRISSTPAAWEHSFEGYTDKLFDEGTKRGFGYKNTDGVAWNKNFISWPFKEDKALENPNASDIKFEFWANKPDYDVEWKYDQSQNSYARFNGGKSHIDFESKKQISVKNVVVQFVKEKGPIDKEGHMFYTTTGSGDALVFQNGDVVKATWKKGTTFDRTRFYDLAGKEISFVKGQIWMEEVPAGNQIKYN